MKRHNFDPLKHFKGGNARKPLRYREATFEFGEQVAVLGIVVDLVDETRGTTTKVLQPVSLVAYIHVDLSNVFG